MKKILILLISFLVIAGIYFGLKKSWTKNAKETISLFNSFQSDVHFRMDSNGNFKAGADQIKIQTVLEGPVTIEFYKSERLMKVSWTPVVELRVNDVVRVDNTDHFKSITNEIFYLHYDEAMVMDAIYYSVRSNISPDVQDLVLNFNKMLAHQLTWFFVMSPTEKIATQKGVDIWGANILNIENKNNFIHIKTQSADTSGVHQVGTGQFVIERSLAPKIHVSGEQNSIMGDATNPTAMTVNKYQLKTINYKDVIEEKINVNLNGLTKTLPWIVVDAKALKASALKEKLKDWNREKLQKAVFGFKGKKDAPFKERSELSLLLADMLFMDHTLAKSYYDWIKKLGPEHVLYDELVKALYVVGCKDCQRYLVDITNDYKKNKDASQKALIGIGFLEGPLESTEEAVRRMAEDQTFANNMLADYVLGAMAGTLEADHPTRAIAIDKEYSEKLKKSTNPVDLRRNLMVLGNSGLCSDVKQISDRLQDKDDGVKKDAIFALRFCKDESVAKIYWKIFKNDSELHNTLFEAMDLRLEKGIIEKEQYDQFEDWLKNDSSKEDDNLKRQVITYLRSFSWRAQEYKVNFSLLEKNCADHNLCDLF